jgi:hypothetical protein
VNRRALLALLGVGSVGGAAVVLSRQNPQDGSTDDDSPNQTSTATAPEEGTSADWGHRLQSELGDRSTYGNVSYATTAQSVDIEESDLLTAVGVEPVTSESDLFWFRAPERTALEETVALVRGTFRIGHAVSFTASLDGASIPFSGGPSAMGPFAAAVGRHPTEPEVLVVRASEADRLAEVAASRR